MSKRQLSPKEVAQCIGVSESSVKRWVDSGRLEAFRTAGGHRRILFSELARFVRESKRDLAQPEILGVFPEAFSGGGNSLLADLISGDAAAAHARVLSQYLEGAKLESIFDNEFRPALNRLGELWLEREDGILIEHRAVSICTSILSQLAQYIPEATGPVAIGGAAGGDIYQLPTLLVALVLKSEGFQAVNLGSDTPTSTLLSGAAIHKAELIWLSVSSVSDPKQMSAELREFVTGLSLMSCPLLIGGRELNRLSLPEHSLIHAFDSLSEMSAFLRGRASSRS